MAKILIVGNDIEQVDIMALSAEGLGYETLTLYESIDTVEQAVEASVDLVILQEKMDIFNGYETSSNLRADPDVPTELPILMVIKGTIHQNDLDRAGVTDVLPVEMDPATLREVLVRYTGE